MTTEEVKRLHQDMTKRQGGSVHLFLAMVLVNCTDRIVDALKPPKVKPKVKKDNGKDS